MPARHDDMHRQGHGILSVNRQPDGDITVRITGLDQWTQNEVDVSVEFCTEGAGGGRSPSTMLALSILINSIDADNDKHPSHDGVLI